MTISSSLNAGVMGLNANATKLATISDNIANSSTYGYKRADADFHSMVISGTGGSYSAGGVRVTTRRLIDEAGPLITTSNSTDLAVRGRGMLPVTTETAVKVDNGEFPMMLSTTGSYRTDEEGYLKSETGLVLLGWPADPDGTIPTYPRDTHDGLEPIKINVNQFGGEPTTEMSLGLNLPATSTELASIDPTEDYEVLNIEYFDNLGTSESLNFEFRPTAASGGLASNEWSMVITDSATIPSSTVIGEYVMTFNDTRTAGGTLASVTTVTGGTYDATNGTIEIPVAGGPIEVTIGQLNDADGITQLADNFAPVNISKDGSAVGNMIQVEVDANGYVHALYDIGITRQIYQIPLVDMPNPNGLVSLDNQTYQISNESGSYFLWDAGDGPTGDIVSYAREESATDVANELTDLIQTQRAYTSNAKVIQTVDEMLQETTNIKR
ncbi:flagellar hook protein FlgE [Poseidonocella sp. HB161398]|uniref:flagellar hook protein FlgE n=1 Tax=Poseidonocella sp. HB161398 TaxID=2320855 RepID=UPI001107C18C|nr:flagellar hook-basal body complex protein [Poseidonocella sp. HB161398]